MGNINYLRDQSFLKQLDNQTLKRYVVNITILTRDELPIKSIEGRVTGKPVININGDSAVRRTASLSFIALESENDLEDIDNLLSMNRKVELKLGLYNDSNSNYDNIIWFKLGIFVIANPNLSHTMNGVNINLSLKDKMCLLNGECGGTLPTSVTFDSYDQLDENGNRTSVKNLIYDIIQTAVCNYGGEAISKIFIDDIDLDIKQIMRYVGSDNLYYNPNTNEYRLDASYISENDNNWKVFKFNEDVGYIYTDFTYPGSLITNIGDNVCSVLDKIVATLGNYEYFYDIEGNFIFREKRNYLNTSYDPTIKKYDDLNYASIIGSDDYEIDFSSSRKTIYTFEENNGLISSYTNTPNYSNIKNDYHIWGKNQDGYAIHYHLAIKNKPTYLNMYDVIFITDDEGEYTGQLRLPTDEEEALESNIRDMTYSIPDDYDALVKQAVLIFTKNYTVENRTLVDGKVGKIVQYIPNDWRAELYLQGLTAQKEGRRPDIYQQELIDLFDSIYNFKEKKFKDDTIKPNNLMYWFDYIDPVGKLANYSVDVVGIKSMAYQQDNINKLYGLDVPDVVITTQDENKLKHRERCEQEGQQFADVEPSVFASMAIGTVGYSADEVARSLIYQHIDYNQSITLQAIPIYYLDVNSRITVQDAKSGIYGDYIIKTISLPLVPSDMMTITASRALERY